MEPAGERSAGRAWTLAAYALVFVATLVVFAPTLSAGFVNWDDETGIARNHGFRGLGGEQLRWMFTTSTLGHFQPLSWLSLALDHALYGLSAGAEPPEAGRFHLTSVVLHALTAIAFLGLSALVLARVLPRAPARTRLAGATFAALLFALHPLRAESVAWLTERRDVLSGLLFVGAIALWWRSAERVPEAVPNLRRALGATAAAVLASVYALECVDLSTATLALERPSRLGLATLFLVSSAALASSIHARTTRAQVQFLLALVLALGSLLSKAWGIVLPAVLLVLDLWPLARHGAPGAGRARRVLALVAEKAPWFALSLVFARLAAWAQGSLPGTMVGLERHSILERLVQGLYGLAWYPLKTVWPAGLSPYVELPPELSLATPRFALAALAVVLAFALAFGLRRRMPALLAALVAFAVIVSPVLGVLQSGPQLVADRYSYLSGLPLALLAGGALVALAARAAPGRALALGVGGLWIGAVALLGASQVRVWRDSETLWRHALAVDPGSAFAATKLAQVELARADLAAEAGGREDAVRRGWTLLEEARREDDPVWLTTAAHAARLLAQTEPARRSFHLERSVRWAEAAVRLQGDAVHPEMRLNLATTLIEAGQPARAVAELEAFTRARPNETLGWINLGVALAASGRPQRAIEPLERGLALEPGYTKGWRFLARAREEAGDFAGALEAWRRVLEGWPRHAEARARVQALGG